MSNKNPFIHSQQLPGSKAHKINSGNFTEVTDSFLVGGDSSLWLGGIISKVSSFYLLMFVVLVFLILGGRLFYLQLIKGDYYWQLTEGNRLRLEYLPASRGIIFDIFEKNLVVNEPSSSLMVYPQELKESERERAAAILNDLPAEAKEELQAAYLKDNYFPIALMENIEYQRSIEMMLSLKDLSGFKIEVDSRRHYQLDNGLAHLLGYTSRITPAEKDGYLRQGYLLTERVGRSGIEEKYQEVLRGQLGIKKIEVDSLGREQKVVAQEPSQPGHNVFLNIDSGLQEEIVKILGRNVPHQGAAVVALDPRNGQVRSLVSWPLFDHNAFSQGMSVSQYQEIINNPLNPLFNRAISGTYPSGSTIKLILSAAGLQEGLINRSSQVSSVGGVWYDKWFFPDWKAGGHGLTNIIKALAESVNTFFYYLALEELDGHHGLGIEKMLKYYSSFGLGQLTKIDLMGEAPGFLPSPEWKEEVKDEIWYPGDTLHLAIGQGDILVTPIQVASFTAAVANGGTLYQPELVNKIVDAVSGEITAFQPEILNQRIVDKKYLEIVKEGMRAAVTSGSARGIYGLNSAIAGKTGTAQVAGEQKPHAWFTSFGPSADPQLVVTVLVENAGEGSEIAVPIAREIWQWYEANRW